MLAGVFVCVFECDDVTEVCAKAEDVAETETETGACVGVCAGV